MVHCGVRQFRSRIFGYSRHPVRDEFAAIDREHSEAQRRRDELHVRIENVVRELDSAYSRLREYERLHAENPSREPIACFVRYTLYVATSKARSIEEEGRRKARAVAARGEEKVMMRFLELMGKNQEALNRLREVAVQADNLVDATLREFAELSGKLAGGQKIFKEWIRETAP